MVKRDFSESLLVATHQLTASSSLWYSQTILYQLYNHLLQIVKILNTLDLNTYFTQDLWSLLYSRAGFYCSIIGKHHTNQWVLLLKEKNTLLNKDRKPARNLLLYPDTLYSTQDLLLYLQTIHSALKHTSCSQRFHPITFYCILRLTILSNNLLLYLNTIYSTY